MAKRKPDVFLNGLLLLGDDDAPDGHGDYFWEPGQLLPTFGFNPKEGHVLILARANGDREAFIYRGGEWLGGVASVVKAIKRLHGVRGVRVISARDVQGDYSILMVTAARKHHAALQKMAEVFIGGTFAAVRCMALIRAPGLLGDADEAAWRLGQQAKP